MAGEWTNTTLGDCADLLTGFPFKSREFLDVPGVRLARGDNVKRGSFDWSNGKAKYWLEVTPELEQYVLAEGDVLVGMDGSRVGENWVRVSESDLPCLLVQRVARLRARAMLDQRFLRFLIGTPPFAAYVKAVHTGTSIPHISGGQIRQFPILLPPLRDQQAIACVLGALDDKIELNRQRNRTLEAMARAIFQSWFVDFDPVQAKAAGRTPPGLSPALAALFPDRFEDSELGHIPKGWKVGRLSDVAEIVMGTSPPGDTYNDCGIGVPLVNGPVEFGDRFAVRSKWTTADVRLSRWGDLIFCVRGSTTGRRVIADGEYGLGRGVCAIRGRGGYQAYVDLSIDRHLLRLLGKTSGSVFPSLSAPDIRNFALVEPIAEIVKAFDKVAGPMRARCDALAHESRTLAALRDALLPKLISGELPVPDAERIAGRAM